MSETKLEKVSLETLGNGVCSELFGRALRDALYNIQDPNTKMKDTREVHLVVKITPLTENRDTANYEVTAKTKLAASKGFKQTMYIGLDAQGEPIAKERDPKQTEMFEESKIKNIN